MTTSYVIDLLKDYNSNLARIRDIDMQILELNNADNLVQGGMILSDRLSKSYKFTSSTENIAVEIADKIIMLEEEKKHIKWIIDRINNAIDSLDEVEKKIVTMKIFKDYRWYEVSYECSMYERWCRKRYNIAIGKMAKILGI